MPPHSLTNFEIQKYYQNELKFNGVYWKNNLPKIKDETYVINLYEYKSIRTHWIGLYVNGDDVTHFDRFGVKCIQKNKKFTNNNNIKANIYRIQENDSMTWEYFCTGYLQNTSKWFSDLWMLLY